MENGIGKYIDFSEHANPDIRHVKMSELCEKPILVISWETRKSRFADSESGLFTAITGKFLNTGEKWVLNTGSSIIHEQLSMIEKAKMDNGEKDMSFSCKIVNRGKFCKMVPLEG